MFPQEARRIASGHQKALTPGYSSTGNTAREGRIVPADTLCDQLYAAVQCAKMLGSEGARVGECPRALNAEPFEIVYGDRDGRPSTKRPARCLSAYEPQREHHPCAGKEL